MFLIFSLKDGNEELRKAIQRNASIRVYILFFLLVMSFSLLFLDWYNEWVHYILSQKIISNKEV